MWKKLSDFYGWKIWIEENENSCPFDCDGGQFILKIDFDFERVFPEKIENTDPGIFGIVLPRNMTGREYNEIVTSKKFVDGMNGVIATYEYDFDGINETFWNEVKNEIMYVSNSVGLQYLNPGDNKNHK